jgi:hypothetical protein
MVSLRGIVVAISLLVAGTNPAIAASPEWTEFGDWRVAAVREEMDPTSHVVLRTTFKVDDDDSVYGGDTYEIGFRIFGGSLMTLDTMYGFPAEDSWPNCDFDTASYKVDSGPLGYIATIDRGGSCNAVPMRGPLIGSFSSGSNAKLKLHQVVGSISLRGFAQAWQEAAQLSGRR